MSVAYIQIMAYKRKIVGAHLTGVINIYIQLEIDNKLCDNNTPYAQRIYFIVADLQPTSWAISVTEYFCNVRYKKCATEPVQYIETST